MGLILRVLSLTFFIISLLLNSKVNALVIQVEGLPEQYRVFNWNYEANEAEFNNRRTSDFKSFNFYIPDQYVTLNQDGKINLWESLEKWREGTPRGVTFPRTSPKDDVTRFPFSETYDPSNPSKIPSGELYVGLGEALRNQKSIPDLRITSSDGNKVDTTVPIRSIETKLNALRGKTVSCSSNSGKAAECLVCNCANEAMGEDREGRININRTVLRRVQGVDYPNTICSVIWQKSQFSWTIVKKGRFPYMSFRSLSGDNLNECIEASKDAMEQGPWKYDSFYNPNTASPSWGRWSGITHKNHRFVKNPKFRVREDANMLIERIMTGEVQSVE